MHHRCQRHRWQNMATILGCRLLKVNLKAKSSIYGNSTTQRCSNKIIIIFMIEDFFHFQRHWWCTLSREYLREFSKKFEMAVISVADPDLGSGIRCLFDPGPGSGLRNRFFSGSRIPTPYFLELSDKFLSKKFYNSLETGLNFFFSI
jgi:hypothetical protein